MRKAFVNGKFWIGALLMAIGLMVSLQHAISPLAASIAFALTTIACMRSNWLWIAILPIALTIGSLYPLTGQLLFQESDIFLSGAIAGRVFQFGWDPAPLWTSRWRWSPWLLCGTIYLVGIVRGAWELPPSMAGDQLSIFTTRTNAIQHVKTLLFCVAIIPLLLDSFQRKSDDNPNLSWSYFEKGMLISATFVAIIAIAERAVTVGLGDWDSQIRVTGPFTSMHVGDHHIDLFLALALPIVFQFPLRMSLACAFRCLLCIAILYVVFATMTRVTIFAALLNISALTFLRFIHFRREVSSRSAVFVPLQTAPDKRNERLRLLAGGVVCLIIMLTTSWMIWQNGGAIPKRFQAVARGWQERNGHWNSILALSRRSTFEFWLGAGVGRFPIEFRRAMSRDEQPIGLISDVGNTSVRLAAGQKIYLEQLISLNHPLPWRLKADIRKSADRNTKLSISICQKTILQSFACTRPEMDQAYDSSQTRSQARDMEYRNCSWTISKLPGQPLNSLGNDMLRWCPSTIGFSANGDNGEWIQLANIELLDSLGVNILKNPDFGSGSRFWFFTSDNHADWRALNSFLQILFETGLLGLSAFLTLLVTVFVGLIRQAFFFARWQAIMLLFSLLGFLQIAFFGSLVDTPALAMLIVLHLILGQAYSTIE